MTTPPTPRLRDLRQRTQDAYTTLFNAEVASEHASRAHIVAQDAANQAKATADEALSKVTEARSQLIGEIQVEGQETARAEREET